MGLLSFLKGRVGKKQAGAQALGNVWIANPTNAFGVNGLKPADFYKSWVYGCVRAISQEISNIQLVLKERNPSTGKVEIVEKSPAVDLLLNPNPISTKQSLFSRLQADEELFGNEYWQIVKVNELPILIIPLRPEGVKPVRGKTRFIEKFEVMKVNGTIDRLDPEDVVHFKNFNPLTDLVGFSTLGAAQDAVETDVSARIYNQEFFDNGARPGVLLTSKSNLEAKKKKEISRDFDQLFSGQGRRYKTAIADGGLDIKEFSTSQKDMEFMEQRIFSRDEILAIFGVPRLILGIVEDVNRSTAEASLFVFARQTIEPKMRAIVDTLTRFYLPMFPDTENQFFEFKSAIPKNKEALVQEYSSGITNGWLTPNEVRAFEGLTPLKDGDNTYLPLNLAEVSEPVKTPKAFKPLKLSRKSVVEELTDALGGLIKADNDAKILASKVESPEKDDVSTPNIELMSDELESRGEMKTTQERKRIMKDEVRYAKESQKLFKSQQRTATKNLVEALKETNAGNIIKKQEGEVKPEDVPELLDRDKEIAKTIALFTPLMLSSIKREGDIALDFVGSDDTLALGAKPSRKFVDKHVKKFAEETVDFTMDTLKANIAEGLTEGEGIRELTKRIQDSTAFNKARSEKIARTEAFRMKTQGELEGWKKADVPSKIWYTSLDERVCPACAALHGKQICLEDPFQELGDVDARGITISFEPVVGAPQHPQCRCTLLPSFEPCKSVRHSAQRVLTTDDKLEMYNKLVNEEEED